jgi:hypothetical protein
LKNNFLKTLGFLILIAGLTLVSAPYDVGAQTASSRLEMTVIPAFSGNYKYGEWLPLWITLSNDGADIEGIVQVEISQSGGNVTFAKSISLPAGSRKQTTLSILPNNFSRELEVEFLSNQEVIKTNLISVSPNQNDSIMVGVSARERGGLSLISNIQRNDTSREVVLFDLLGDLLPEKSREFESIDVIVLNDTDTSQLTPQQKAALDDWVSKGGHLIIGGGPGLEKTISGISENLINFTVSRTIEINDLTNLEKFADNQDILLSGPFTFAQIVPTGGTPLIQEEGIQILTQWEYGHGMISVSALDLATSPFNAWSGTTNFWINLLSSDLQYPTWMPRDISLRQMRANSMSYPLSNLPSLDIPSVRALGILLILYIVVIGPVNFLLLKLKNKLHLAWVTIPALTVLFALGAFGLAYSLRGNDIMINKLSIIDLTRTGRANIDSYVGIFSPSQSAYEIEIAGDHLLSPSYSGYYDPWSSSSFSVSGNTTFLQDNPSRVLGLSVNQWSMQSFNIEAINAELGKIQSTLSIKSDKIAGQIRSQLPFTIEDAVLVAGQNTFALGNLIPGQDLEIEVPHEDQNLNPTGNPLTYQILESAYPGYGFDYQRDYETKRAILDNYFQPYGYWLGPEFGSDSDQNSTEIYFSNFFIIGWTSEVPLDIKLNGREASQNTLGVIVAQVPINLDSGEYIVPASFLEGEIIEQPGTSGYCGSAKTHLYMDFGTTKFKFNIPPSFLNTEITQLSVFFGEDISQWSQEDPGFSLWIYNWKKSTWTQIPDMVKGTNTIQVTDGLINPDGTIHLQLDKEGRNSGGCVYVGLGFEGSGN